MIDPSKITNYDLTDWQLEEVLLFWVCAAGKNGHTAAKCLHTLLSELNGYEKGPFNALRDFINKHSLPVFAEKLKEHGIGCYTIKAKTMSELVSRNVNLRTCSIEDLESIYGIGPKTARCFLLHSRKNYRAAGLDTHILKHLRSLGYDAPLTTPSSSKKYLTLERIVLSLADKAGMSPADYDLMVWNKYAKRHAQNKIEIV